MVVTDQLRVITLPNALPQISRSQAKVWSFTQVPDNYPIPEGVSTLHQGWPRPDGFSGFRSSAMAIPHPLWVPTQGAEENENRPWIGRICVPIIKSGVFR